ncbi:MAG: class I SAM-dependent methyltransferase [Treponema sp.]|nr:class I SAM-dependent methyltransferase [Treponema sp.]
MAEAGHVFLARIGKTTLRPGGIDATAWLIEQADIQKNTKILEVACHMGRTMIQLCERFGCSITGVDLDKEALSHAEENIKKRGMEDKLKLVHGDAMKLPFDDRSFDIVINEAMLTMLIGDDKNKALGEYMRVLKPGGLLLTHDVVFFTEDKETQKDLRAGLSRALNVHVEPFDARGWKSVFEKNGFSVRQKTGALTLMRPSGMIRDEGLVRVFKIIRNAMKKENRPIFQKMFRYFNGHKDQLGYICTVGTKPFTGTEV